MNLQTYAAAFKPAIIDILRISTFKGSIPADYELVEYEKGTDPEEEGLVLYGFDELYTMGFKKPQHCFMRLSDGDKAIDDFTALNLAPGSLS
jgi:hypothetical protein